MYWDWNPETVIQTAVKTVNQSGKLVMLKENEIVKYGVKIKLLVGSINVNNNERSAEDRRS